MPKYTHSVSWTRQIESDYEDFDDVLRHEPDLVADHFSDLQELRLDTGAVECSETVENEEKGEL